MEGCPYNSILMFEHCLGSCFSPEVGCQHVTSFTLYLLYTSCRCHPLWMRRLCAPFPMLNLFVGCACMCHQSIHRIHVSLQDMGNVLSKVIDSLRTKSMLYPLHYAYVSYTSMIRSTKQPWLQGNWCCSSVQEQKNSLMSGICSRTCVNDRIIYLGLCNLW